MYVFLFIHGAMILDHRAQSSEVHLPPHTTSNSESFSSWYLGALDAFCLTFVFCLTIVFLVMIFASIFN